MRYRAFLSYSHADSEFADRFHKDLERWRSGRGLAGRETRNGPVPADVRPIFRDRDDFAGGGTLAEATNKALEASDFLVLLCSPAAARSAYVNEEIRSFKAMGGSDRIIPVIIDGEPGDPEQECFPEALIRKVGPDGELTDEIEDRLAADARSVGDGPRRALAKVIAGLLGVSFDEIVRRAELAQRRRNRIYASVAMVMTVLAVMAGVFGWLAETRRVAAERNYQAAVSAADSVLSEVGEELIRTEGIALDTTKRLLGRAESIYDELISTMPDAKEVKFGKVAALGVFARAYYAKGDLAAARDAATRAEALTEALVADGPQGDAPQVPLAMMRAERARLMVTAGDFDGAIRVLDEALTVLTADYARNELDNPAAHYVVGVGIQLALLRATQGDPDGGTKVLDAVDKIVSERSGDATEGLSWPVIRASSLATRGAIEEQRGNLDDARDLLTQAIKGMRAGVAERPDWPQIRALLGNTLRAAATLAARLDDTQAMAKYTAEADALQAELATADSESRTARTDAAARGVEQAIERVESGDVADGVAELSQQLDSLIAANGAGPINALHVDAMRLALRRAVKVFNDNRYYGEALATARRLLTLERGAVQGLEQRDARSNLAFALGQAADAADGLKQLSQALAFSEQALELERLLAKADPDRRSLLVEAEWRSALLLWRLSRRGEAEARYTGLVALFASLAAEQPTVKYYGSSLSWTCVNLGELKALNGKLDEARTVFEQCLVNGERMLANDPADRQLKLNLAWAEARMALVGDDRERWQRAASLLAAADAEAPLEDLEEELLTVARISAAR